jgi:hypothetical protein
MIYLIIGVFGLLYIAYRFGVLGLGQPIYEKDLLELECRKRTKPENAKKKCSHIWTGNKEIGRYCKWCGKGGVIQETKPEKKKVRK